MRRHVPGKRITVFGLLILALLVTASGQAGPAALDKNRAPFADPAGDQTLTAPDITQTVVSNNDEGTIIFEITIANYSSLQGRISFIVFLDTDVNTATGNPSGADHALLFGYQTADVLTRGVGTWINGDFRYAVPRSYSASFTPAGQGGVATLAVDRAQLGRPNRLRFSVYGYWFVQPVRNYYWDLAPNPPATPYAYDLGLNAGKPPPDRDHDGVPDSQDRCPRAGAFFDFNKNGCTGPFRRMRPDLKFRALGYSSYVTMASARIEDLPSGARVEVRCRNACRVSQRQTARSPIVVLTRLRGARLDRGAVIEIRAVKPGWIGYDARIEIRGMPLATHVVERCLPAIGAPVPGPCSRIERGS